MLQQARVIATGMPIPLRVALVDDHATVREGVRLLIERQPGIVVTAEASSGDEAIRLGDRDDIDVVVMDLSMPGGGGLVAVRALRERRPDLKLVILTRHADVTYLQELRRAGASGYVLKQSAPSELLKAIQAAAAGEEHVDAALTRHLAAPFVGSSLRQRQAAATGATERERQVLRLSALGYSNKEIAEQLAVVVKTVEVHKTNGMRKLHLYGRIELLRFALLQGWLADAHQHDREGLGNPLG
jgi:two-component system, NarL family, response regulator NreC